MDRDYRPDSKLALVSQALIDVRDERHRQVDEVAEHLPDGTGDELYVLEANHSAHRANVMAKIGKLTWRDVLTRVFYKALAETDQGPLRAWLVSLAAAAVAWIEDIDSRSVK